MNITTVQAKSGYVFKKYKLCSFIVEDGVSAEFYVFEMSTQNSL